MSNSGDLYLLNDSRRTLTNEFTFERKEIITTIDSNSGAYPNGCIDIDLASISNSGALVDFKNSKLVIPYVVVVTGTDAADAGSCWALSMKNHIHCIDSISVQFGNNSVVEITETSNIPLNFKLLSELSEQELNLYGPSIGFQKDSAFGLTMETANSINCPISQERNNDASSRGDAIGAGTDFANYQLNHNGYNSAILKRQCDTSLDLTTIDARHAAAQLNGKNYCRRIHGPAPVVSRIVYYGMLTLELKYLNDFFSKLPLIRNSYMKMKIYTNLQSKTTVNFDRVPDTVVGGITVPEHWRYTSFANSLSAKTCPYMIAPTSQGTMFAAATASGSFTIESGVVKVGVDPEQIHPFQNCRLVCPTYVPTIDIGDKYFLNPVKTILYDAYFKTSVTIGDGRSFNSFLVTSGLSRIRSILLVPMSDYAAPSPNVLLSPFTSCPTTCSPYAFVDQFNIRLGGSPVYSQNQYYSYEMFQEEILARGVNGNKSPFMCSGLINQTEWDRSYRYIYVDLARKAGQGADNVSKSITIDGHNISGKSLLFLIYVQYQKELRVNVETGKLVLD